MAFAKRTEEVANIKPANIIRTTIRVVGTAPLVQNKFSQKAKETMLKTMATPKNEKKAKSERPIRNYAEEFVDAQHIAVAGWNGVPCSGIRAAMIDACRTVGIVMTRAKMSVFVIADGFDKRDGTPLVRIYSDKPPEQTEMPVRLDSGVTDIRVRPMWREWYADVTIDFDGDMITGESVINLLDRAGRQVGLCEGRPFSKNSVGQGWGTFQVEASKPKGKK